MQSIFFKCPVNSENGKYHYDTGIDTLILQIDFLNSLNFLAERFLNNHAIAKYFHSANFQPGVASELSLKVYTQLVCSMVRNEHRIFKMAHGFQRVEHSCRISLTLMLGTSEKNCHDLL